MLALRLYRMTFLGPEDWGPCSTHTTVQRNLGCPTISGQQGDLCGVSRNGEYCKAPNVCRTKILRVYQTNWFARLNFRFSSSHPDHQTPHRTRVSKSLLYFEFAQCKFCNFNAFAKNSNISTSQMLGALQYLDSGNCCTLRLMYSILRIVQGTSQIWPLHWTENTKGAFQWHVIWNNPDWSWSRLIQIRTGSMEPDFSAINKVTFSQCQFLCPAKKMSHPTSAVMTGPYTRRSTRVRVHWCRHMCSFPDRKMCTGTYQGL